MGRGAVGDDEPAEVTGRMTVRTSAWVGLLVAACVAAGSGRIAGAAEFSGTRLYLRHCASCHGATGRGDGPDASFFEPAPRDLREGFLKKYSTDDLVRRVREGKPLEIALDLPALRQRATETESIVAHLRRLPSINWRLTEPGWEIYLDRCQLCHGAFGRPGPTLPKGVRASRDISDPAFQRATNEEDLLVLVRHGRKHMPALVPRVTTEDATLLVRFVRLLSPGFELYSRCCANCHGDDGRGVNSLVESIRIPTVLFDREYFQRRTPEQIREAVWHMLRDHKAAMPHYRSVIGEGEARAIVEYLKTAE